jgi:hypothetical protein
LADPTFFARELRRTSDEMKIKGYNGLILSFKMIMLLIYGVKYLSALTRKIHPDPHLKKIVSPTHHMLKR